MTSLDIDLWDHDAFQRQEHHELLARLRDTCLLYTSDAADE